VGGLAFGLPFGSSAVLNYFPFDSDLTDGGTADRVRVDVDFVRAGTEGRLGLSVSDSLGGFDNMAVDFSAPGVLDFQFASFSGVDFTRIDSIRLSNVPTTSGSDNGWRIAEISSATPESGTGLLLAAGLTGLALKRRRLGK